MSFRLNVFKPSLTLFELGLSVSCTVGL